MNGERAERFGHLLTPETGTKQLLVLFFTFEGLYRKRISLARIHATLLSITRE
jgi:hypothetical protein